MAEPDLKHIPLEQLKVSKLNMRHGRKKPDVSDILPSIRQRGIRQTLLVRKEGNGYGIVAGRRRFFALKEIAKETGQVLLIPCAVMPENDAAAAIEASVIENVGRLPASEMEQYTAFKRLSDEGRSIDEIASFFGVRELLVRRVMALASLIAPIRKLYADDEIDRATIRALTLATEAQQAEWVRLHSSEDERAPIGRNCRAWVTGGVSITTDKALFELEHFEGEIIGDLFGDHGVFADPEAFWRAQSTAVSEKVDALKNAGWCDVICLERGQYFQRWEHVERSLTEGGKVFVEIRHDGTVTFHEGYLTQAEARRRQKNSSDESGPTGPIKPEMSGPLAEYVLLHRHGAAQASLLKHPAIALRLMIAHAMTGSALWDVRAHECRSRKPETRASVEASSAANEVITAGEKVDNLFQDKGAYGKARRNSDSYRIVEIFAALLQMSDEDVLDIVAYIMSETLEAGGSAVEAVLHVCEADPSKYWQPDEAFWSLVRDKRAINAMVEDIGSKTLADECRTDTAKVQKQLITNRIDGIGCEPNVDWRPGWMSVPPRRYVSDAPSPPVDAWERVSRLFDAINAGAS
ncbi:MAG: ParB/RepB/Spo0J family partition protein [Hyphomonadaceae bacterium]|nr:ParB/RepB/Spo0J family partition protein [Hyphomonadaceae bacterium]